MMKTFNTEISGVGADPVNEQDCGQYQGDERGYHQTLCRFQPIRPIVYN